MLGERDNHYTTETRLQAVPRSSLICGVLLCASLVPHDPFSSGKGVKRDARLSEPCGNYSKSLNEFASFPPRTPPGPDAGRSCFFPIVSQSGQVRPSSGSGVAAPGKGAESRLGRLLVGGPACELLFPFLLHNTYQRYSCTCFEAPQGCAKSDTKALIKNIYILYCRSVYFYFELNFIII